MIKKNPLKIFVSLLLILIWAAISACLVIPFVEKKFLYPLKFEEQIILECQNYNLNPFLVSALINTESSFNPNATSNKNAKGLMQITDNTANYVAVIMGEELFDLYDVETNLKFGCFYLRYLLNKFENEKTALCAYNAGEGNVRTWLKNPDYSDDGITLKRIPFPETENYLEKIYKSLEKYRNLYGNILDKPS